MLKKDIGWIMELMWAVKVYGEAGFRAFLGLAFPLFPPPDSSALSSFTVGLHLSWDPHSIRAYIMVSLSPAGEEPWFPAISARSPCSWARCETAVPWPQAGMC